MLAQLSAPVQPHQLQHNTHMHLLVEAAVSPQDKAVEEDECQELDNEVHQPAGPLLAEADEPVAVPDSLLLLQGLSMCQPLQAVTHTQEGGNELHHPDHTALQTCVS